MEQDKLGQESIPEVIEQEQVESSQTIPSKQAEVVVEVEQTTSESPSSEIKPEDLPQVIAVSTVEPPDEIQPTHDRQVESPSSEEAIVEPQNLAVKATEEKAQPSQDEVMAEAPCSDDKEEGEQETDKDSPKEENQANQAWNKGRHYAQRTVKELSLKKKLSGALAEKELAIKQLGELVYQYAVENSLLHPDYQQNIDLINQTVQQVVKLEKELLELDEISTEGYSFWKKIKKTISRYAGYTKLKLDISMLKNEKESMVASLGQFIYSRQDTLESHFNESRVILEQFDEITELEQSGHDIEKQLNELE